MSRSADVLRDSTVPCLLYAGDADPFYARTRQTAQELPDATFASLAGLGHIQAWFAPDMVLPHAMNFLRSVSERVG